VQLAARYEPFGFVTAEYLYKAFITCPQGDENSTNLNKFILATSVAHLLPMSHLLNRFSSRMIFKFKLPIIGYGCPISFKIENAARSPRNLATEPFQPLQPIPEFS